MSPHSPRVPWPWQEVIAVASSAAVAWLESHFRPDQEGTRTRVEGFWRWVESRKSEGLISFDVKS